MKQEDLESLHDELGPLYSKLENSRQLYMQQKSQLDNKLSPYLIQRTSSTTTGSNRIGFSSSNSSAAGSAQKPQNIMRSFTTQAKKDNPNRRSHKRTNVTHSDRIRAAQSNSNNVWCRAEQFFLPIPTNQEIEKMFAIRKVPEIKEFDGEVKHWSLKMAPPSCRANGKADMPPGPPSSSDDTAEYWIQNRAWFQIEKIQKANCSPLHCLLNALVDVEPLDAENKMEKKKVYARSHALLPVIEDDDYMVYSFDIRLNLELESLGLNQPQKSSNKDSPFQNEIIELRDKIANVTIPAIDRLYNEIMENIDKYREDQAMRSEKIENVDRLITEANSKKRKRKD